MYADHFSIANIPFGIASSSTHSKPGIVTRLKEDVIFLSSLIEAKLLSDIPQSTLDALGEVSLIQKLKGTLPGDISDSAQTTLNSFAALPKSAQREVRVRLQHVLHPENGISVPSSAIANVDNVKMHLPMTFSEFTDFSCSKDHVLNAGEAIGMGRKLPPGFLHFPIGYAGRVSSIVVSGTPIARPLGQFRTGSSGDVTYGPTQQLDYELEIACIVGKPLPHGQRVSAADAEEHIFGLVLLNDWSCRFSINRPGYTETIPR